MAVRRFLRPGTSRGNSTTGNTSNQMSNIGGANHLSATEYARRCRLILELRDDLYNLDTGPDLKLDFPRIVVIGDQSSGKSSLVEAVSGINVPRDHGTCTRCPMECIMRGTSGSWSCSISLQLSYDSDGNPLPSTTPIPFGKTIYNKSSVDLWVRRAQAAVLSRHISHTEFLGKSEAELKNEVDPQRLQFSKNSVRIEINDPESPPLDFVDLPGIVHSETSLHDEVVEMVLSHITQANTLILIAMPVTTDWQVQMAVRLAKDADPNGNRTIGIITKPDALQEGDIGRLETWQRVLANEEPECNTKHGYYCVRLPSDRERTGSAGNPRSNARNIEDNFFNTCTPWNRIEYRSRCGIPNFVKNISALLEELIEKYLPALQAKVDHYLDLCLKDIASLPPMLDREASTEILLRISAFCQAFKDAVFGRDHLHFVQRNKLRYSRFSDEIYATQPVYTPFVAVSVFSIPPSSTKSVSSVNEVPRKGPCLNLEDVRRLKEGTITWELPPHVPFNATVQLVHMYTSMWEDPSLECFDDVMTNSINFGETLLGAHFGQYGELLSFVRQLTSQERNRCRDDARITLKKILRFESLPLFTQNQAFLQSEKIKWLNEHCRDHKELRYRQLYEEHHQEHELMADSYAYFQVAHKRVIDYVPLSIEHELNQAFTNNLQPLLFSKLTAEGMTPGRLEELVRENPAIEERRVVLENRRRTLVTIKRKIDDFWSLTDNREALNHSSRNASDPRQRTNSIASTIWHEPQQQLD